MAFIQKEGEDNVGNVSNALDVCILPPTMVLEKTNLGNLAKRENIGQSSFLRFPSTKPICGMGNQ
jgi:hypothetical protein